jgi:hypothetical protein
MITHRRRNVQKFVAKQDMLAENAIEALQSAVVNDVAFVLGDGPLDQLIAPVKIPSLSADIYNVSEVMMRDIYEISGVNEYLRGATPEIRRTATEATIIEGASNVKSQFKLRQIEKASRRVGTIMLRVAKDVFPLTDFDEMQLYLTGREAEQINRAALGSRLQGMMGEGAPPEELAALYGQTDLQADAVISPTPDIWIGQYEVEVEQSSTELRNPVMKEQKYREMAMKLVEMAPILMQVGVPINLKKVMELWFEAAGIDDIDAMFEAGPMPGQASPQAAPPAEGGGGAIPPGQPNQEGANPLAMGPFGSENTGALPSAQ